MASHPFGHTLKLFLRTLEKERQVAVRLRYGEKLLTWYSSADFPSKKYLTFLRKRRRDPRRDGICLANAEPRR